MFIFFRLKDVLEFVSQVRKYKISTQSKSLSYKKTQYLLKTLLQTMFPKQEMLEEYKHPDIVSASGQFFELDYFFPHLNLAIEYQVPLLSCSAC